jgi:hypothetical protein
MRYFNKEEGGVHSTLARSLGAKEMRITPVNDKAMICNNQ